MITDLIQTDSVLRQRRRRGHMVFTKWRNPVRQAYLGRVVSKLCDLPFRRPAWHSAEVTSFERKLRRDARRLM